MRKILILAVLAAAIPALALAEDLPQFPKVAPPEPLPDAVCDTTLASTGDWLIGRWVAPQTRWDFSRNSGGIAWTLERKGGMNSEFGWQDGTQIDGIADKITGCTIHLSAGPQKDGAAAFQFQGVLTEAGKLYGFATNRRGENVRFVLRRER